MGGACPLLGGRARVCGREVAAAAGGTRLREVSFFSLALYLFQKVPSINIVTSFSLNEFRVLFLTYTEHESAHIRGSCGQHSEKTKIEMIVGKPSGFHPAERSDLNRDPV